MFKTLFFHLRLQNIGGRSRSILTGIIGLLFAKGVSFATLLITIPLMLRYLGTEQFGVWMTLTSLSAVLVVGDLGIGNGIKTEIARAYAREDSQLMRKILLNGAFTQLFLSFVFCFGTVIAHQFYDWAAVFNVKNVSDREAVNSAALTFMLISFAAGPLSIGSRIRAGMQRESVNGVWSSISSIAALGGLLLGVFLKFNLSALVAAFIGIPVIINAIATATTLYESRSVFWPQLTDFEFREVRRLFFQGLRYFAITIVYILTFTIDNIVIARMLGPSAVAQYTVAERLFQVISVALTMVNAPFWPAYTAAHATGDHAWVLRTFRRAIVASLLFCVLGAVVLLIFSQPLYRLWIGAAIMPPLTLLLATAARRVAEAIYSTCSVLMNSLDEMWLQIGWGLAMSIVAMAARIVLIPYLGLSGVAWGVTLAVVCLGFVPTFIAVRRLKLAASYY